MRLSDESTEKFEIELANEQVKKIKQAINDCQLRFGKVMGCGTCKALQLCTWAKELSSTIESMGKYIEALQQENGTAEETYNFLSRQFNKERAENEQLKKLLYMSQSAMNGAIKAMSLGVENDKHYWWQELQRISNMINELLKEDER